MHRILLSIVSMLLFSFTAMAQQSSPAPPKWSYGNIPFGSSRSEISEQFPKNLHQDGGDCIEPFRYSVIKSELRDGIFGGRLHEKTSCIDEFEDKSTPSSRSICFHFYGNDMDSKLFMVSKALRQPQSPSDFIETAIETISKITGVEPKITKGTVVVTSVNNPNPAIVAKWTTPTTHVYFLSESQKAWIPIILYIDRAGWDQYISNINDSIANEEAENASSNRKTIERNF